jgi:proteasome lid subunit RPN8/RPN11
MNTIRITQQVLNDVLKLVCEYIGTEDSGRHLGQEVSGFLVGRRLGNGILIGDFITGPQDSGPFHTNLKESFLANVAEEFAHGRGASGEKKREILGWFHSHIGLGLFMSAIDLKTLKNMQRLSPDLAALVVDPLTRERFRFYRYDFDSDTAYNANFKVVGKDV